MHLFRDAHLLEVLTGEVFGVYPFHAGDTAERQGAVGQHREVGEEVEALRDHACLAAGECGLPGVFTKLFTFGLDDALGYFSDHSGFG